MMKLKKFEDWFKLSGRDWVVAEITACMGLIWSCGFEVLKELLLVYLLLVST